MKYPIRVVMTTLFAIVFISFSGCTGNEKPTESPAGNNNLRTLIDLADIANYWVVIDGKKYNVGDPFSKFIESFEIAETETGIGDKELKPNAMTTVSFIKPSGGYVFACVRNSGNETKLVKECNVYGFKVDQFDAQKYESQFVGEIKVNVTTKDEIKNLLGEPTSTSETSSMLFWRYEPVKGNSSVKYNVTFSKETGVLLLIDIQYID